MTKLLSKLKIKESGVISSFSGESPIRERLMELGLVPGTEIKVKRFAPLGDPMEIVLRGYSLSIRKEDANLILVKQD